MLVLSGFLLLWACLVQVPCLAAWSVSLPPHTGHQYTTNTLVSVESSWYILLCSLFIVGYLKLCIYIDILVNFVLIFDRRCFLYMQVSVRGGGVEGGG